MGRTSGNHLSSAILEEARRLLVAEGHGHLSMRRIASRVGCTATAIYLYFNDKDELVQTLLDEGMESLYGALTGAADGVAEPAERLARVCRAYVDFGLRDPKYYQVMFMLDPERMERYPPEKYRRARRNLEVFEEAIGAALGWGEERAEDLRVAATVVWSSLHGLVSLWITQRLDARIEKPILLDCAVRHAADILGRLGEDGGWSRSGPDHEGGAAASASRPA